LDTGGWSIDEVVGRLRGQTGTDGRAAAHVFLDDAAGENLAASARRLVNAARRGAGGQGTIEIGPIRQLSRSFAVRATPDMIGRLGRQPGVRAVLPSQIDDILPRPVRQSPA
jgi:hypothetical protein